MRCSLLALLAAAASASAKILYAGVAESGGEFGAYGVKGTGLPGRFNQDYAFINKSTIDIFMKKDKINTFRVAFLLERMCPLAYGLGARFNETHFGFYADAINYITSKGAYAILDPHNYMRYNDPSSQPFSGSVIGNSSDPAAATTAQFGAFWGELARRFKSNPNVIFGLMNEPHDMATSLVVKNNQAAITAIRRAGAAQLIIAPGNSWTGGHSWTEGSDPSSAQLANLRDPLSNLAIDIHEYLDVDFSGQHSACVSPAPQYLANVTAWLKTHKLKAIITEFGGDANEGCYSELTTMLDFMSSHDEWIGWTAWAAGPFWGANSPCCTDGAQKGSLEPNVPAADGSAPLYDTVWAKVLRPKVPKTLKKFGLSTWRG